MCLMLAISQIISSKILPLSSKLNAARMKALRLLNKSKIDCTKPKEVKANIIHVSRKSLPHRITKHIKWKVVNESIFRIDIHTNIYPLAYEHFGLAVLQRSYRLKRNMSLLFRGGDNTYFGASDYETARRIQLTTNT